MIEYTEEQTASMVKTARASGAIGRDPLVYRWFREESDCPIYRFSGLDASIPIKVLDYGSGPDAVHARKLMHEGWEIDVMDLALEPFVNTLARSKAPYDVILCSNVLNVQPTMSAVYDVLYDLKSLAREHAMIVVNYPSSPRKAGLSINCIRSAVLGVFGEYADRFKNYPGVMVVGA
jgi:hypothetical protein